MSAKPGLRRELILWCATGAIACLLALSRISATLIAGAFVPGDSDSFYHAHRILDAVGSPAHLVQFDPRIHAPEGSWVTWPWAYDMMMAAIGHIAVAWFGVKSPLSVLVFVAPLWAFLNAALITGIASKLGLSPPVKIIAMLCFAFSPLTQNLHMVGMLDHHFVEYSFVLGTLFFGLHWFQDFHLRGRAIALGVLLGIAPAFHNGLFILQLPVLLTLAIRWCLGRRGESPASLAFGAALLVSTLLSLLPSEPFRRGMFSFELDSWFHLYIAGCTALLTAEFALLHRSGRSLGLIAATALLLSMVIVGQILRAGDFLAGHLVSLKDISEVKGVADYLREGDFRFLCESYSCLLWLMPLGIAGLFWHLRIHSEDADLFFLVMSILGAVLLFQQYRLEDFGSFALYFPLCRILEFARQRWPRQASRLTLACAATAAAAYVPAYGALREHMPVGGSMDYQATMAVYPPLARACALAPGVVLADESDGHYITYHTSCSVIADVFILTRQHEEKILMEQKLMQSSLADVLREAPYVRYIYVRRDDNIYASNCGSNCPENRGLRQELLFNDPASLPRLRLLSEIRIRHGAITEPLARVFQVVPDAPASP